MTDISFSKIASEYARMSIVQQAAAVKLFNLLNIRENDDVLDLGCGSGILTRKIKELTGGRIVGTDLSPSMIEQARINNRDNKIEFYVMDAGELDFENEFDIVFCCSTFQWFNSPGNVLKRIYRVLRKRGQVGIQAPAKNIYSPNFIKAIEAVQKNKKTKIVFSHFKVPWFFLDTAAEYSDLFESRGFTVFHSEIDTITSEYPPEKVFEIFSSGAIAGYLNQNYYDITIDDKYIEDFKAIVKDEFKQQAGENSTVNLVFNRIYLVAEKF